MHRLKVLVPLAGLAVAGLVAGCGPSASSPQAKAREAEVKAILSTPQGQHVKAAIAKCLEKGGNASTVENCIIPGQNKAAFKACAIRSLSKDFGRKHTLENDLTVCVVTAVND